MGIKSVKSNAPYQTSAVLACVLHLNWIGHFII